jgi:hypothetical protein
MKIALKLKVRTDPDGAMHVYYRESGMFFWRKVKRGQLSYWWDLTRAIEEIKIQVRRRHSPKWPSTEYSTIEVEI